MTREPSGPYPDQKRGEFMEEEGKFIQQAGEEPGEPAEAKSKLGEAAVREAEVRGIEELTPAEKKHLLLQLSRDRVKDSSAGPWEIIDIRREQWRAVKDTLVEPVEIDVRDNGRNELFRVLFDITKLERELESIS
ncbi:hypothetical protein [Methanosarcina mazei]|uniref:Uncharacterized protein n=1 Tax=Methanosarcina mazei SarPi TaxID=1434115 RepID=A0A0E3RAY8_METMZ|nr:hypothetical protein [Methanosarcina mazei]AKB61005.1 hypothetical protein MSMAP_1020 [Methanosarcina mazei SarPi]